MLALWLLRRKNLLLLSLANNLRYTDTCFICAFAMVTAVWRREPKHLHPSPSTAFLYLCCASQPLQGIAYTRAVAAVVSVGCHLQPFASSLSALSFHVGSLYLTAHLRCQPVLGVLSFKPPQFCHATPPPPPPPPYPPVSALLKLPPSLSSYCIPPSWRCVSHCCPSHPHPRLLLPPLLPLVLVARAQ
jgi:hypothetical protein